MPNSTKTLIRFIASWLFTSSLLTMILYVFSKTGLNIFFPKSWWFEGGFGFGDLLIINLVYCFFLCLTFFILTGLFKKFINKKIRKLFLSLFLPVIILLLFELITGIHLFLLTNNILYQLAGLLLMLLTGFCIFLSNEMVQKTLNKTNFI
jgi:hypothetical protein